MDRMTDKQMLHRYLRIGREAMVWKLDGVAEYDVRRPLTATGTNLLGLVKHLAVVELDYFGTTFSRPHGEVLPWNGREREPNEDMFASAGETREEIMALYRRATQHADTTIEALELDAVGTVPWWPDDVNPVTLHWILVHMIAETHRHVGHADILREHLDGATGHRADVDNVPEGDEAGWSAHVAQVEAAARAGSG